jgi:dTDP-glucose 4,6-dehydratase
MSNKILVTGSEGFIGSHLVESLVRKGKKVDALVKYNSFSNWGWLDTLHPDIAKNVNVLMADIRDPHHMRRLVEGKDVVFHLAALIAIPHSYSSPHSYVETNVIGTLNLLEASRAAGVAKFIHTSTSEVYGSAKYVPINENHPLNAQSPYAASKIGADQIALSFANSFDLDVTIVRPFNTYGPRQSSRAVIPTILTQILNGARKVKVGSLYPTRDFTFVSDTVEGFLLASKKGNTGDVVNLGSGFEISIHDLAIKIADLLNVEISFDIESIRERPKKSEVLRLFADNSKARELLGWKPNFSGAHGLEEGLKQTINWYSNPLNLSQYKAEIFNT